MAQGVCRLRATFAEQARQAVSDSPQERPLSGEHMVNIWVVNHPICCLQRLPGLQTRGVMGREKLTPVSAAFGYF
jgi:hypothetical protein